MAGGYTQLIIRTKTTSDDPNPGVRWQADIQQWLSVQRQHLLIRTQASGPMRQVAGRYTQVIIHTKTIFDDPDPCIRWQTNIPMLLSVPRQHLMILTHASGGKWIYPSDYPYKDNICWSWPMHQVDIPMWLSIQRQHLMILTHAWGGRQIYPSDYSHKDNICWSWPRRQVVGEYTEVIIHTNTTSHDPDPCVRWQADIPKWLSIQRQHLLILTHVLGGRRIYPSDYPYKDNIYWSWPMR